MTYKARFSHVFQRGHRLRSGSFMAVYAKSDAISRLAFSIGRRAVPSSVRRNRLRRVARERFRQLDLSGFDVVLVAFRGARDTEQAALEEQIECILFALAKRCKD